MNFQKSLFLVSFSSPLSDKISLIYREDDGTVKNPMKESKVLSDAGIYIGSNIRKVRLSKGIKQIEVIRELQLRGFNVTKETMVKWEHGNKHFPASQLKAIKEILNTSYDELFQ